MPLDVDLLYLCNSPWLLLEEFCSQIGGMRDFWLSVIRVSNSLFSDCQQFLFVFVFSNSLIETQMEHLQALSSGMANTEYQFLKGFLVHGIVTQIQMDQSSMPFEEPDEHLLVLRLFALIVIQEHVLQF